MNQTTKALGKMDRIMKNEPQSKGLGIRDWGLAVSDV
jgi:hypothetical protein